MNVDIGSAMVVPYCQLDYVGEARTSTARLKEVRVLRENSPEEKAVGVSPWS